MELTMSEFEDDFVDVRREMDALTVLGSAEDGGLILVSKKYTLA